MTLRWTTKPYSALTPDELYQLLQLRVLVFVVEQNCPFQDLDGRDAAARHLLGHTATGELVAYARLFGPGAYYPEVSIGRVVTAPAYRRRGLGRALMGQALAQCAAAFGPQPIKIAAQYYLRDFYRSFGFAQQGDIYLEDNIEHIHMVIADFADLWD